MSAPQAHETQLQVRLFGQMSVLDAAGQSVLPRVRKTRALLAMLALAAPRPLLRAHIITLLWSSRGKEQARASLRQSVHELQDMLAGTAPNLLVADRNHLALRGPGLWVDVTETLSATPARPDGLQLFRHELLEDLPGLDPAFDHWIDQERRHIRQTARQIAEDVLQTRPTPVTNIQAAERLLDIDCSHEGGWQALIRAKVALGDRGGAVQDFERCQVALAATTRLAPSLETAALLDPLREPIATGAAPPVPLRLVPSRRDTGGIRLGVIPMRTLNATQDDELSLGLAEEITTALSRFRWISCVSATSLANIGPEPAMASPLVHQLDLDFLLEGTIQRVGGRVRVMARLLDMRAGGEVIWAHRFDHQSADILTLQDEIAAGTVAQVDPQLLLREAHHAHGRQERDPTAYDLMLRAIPAIYRLEEAGYQAAGDMLQAAIALDPRNAAAHAWLAYWLLLQVGQGWAPDPIGATALADELAERAVMLDPGDARALTLAGHVRGFMHKRAEEGRTLHARALSLNPNLAMAWCFSGLAHTYLGDHQEGIARIRHAQVLSPYDPHGFFFDMALTMPHLLRGEYEAVVEVGRRAIALNPGFSSSYKGYLAAMGHLGRGNEASGLMSKLLAMEPGFCISSAIDRSPLTRAEDLDRYAEGLRRVGLPLRRNPAPPRLVGLPGRSNAAG